MDILRILNTRRAPRLIIVIVMVAATTWIFSCFGASAYARAATFSDVAPSHPAYQAIESLAASGVVTGDTAGQFRPDSPLTRAQATKILVRWRGVRPAESETVHFPDVDSLYRPYIETACARGWVYGYVDGSFRPYEPITREQIVVVLLRSLGLTNEVQRQASRDISAALSRFKDLGNISPSARPFLALAVSEGILLGRDDKVDPQAPVTRAQYCLILSRAQGIAERLGNAAREALAAFMDTHLFAPRRSPITGAMVMNNVEWYGIPAIAQLVILAAETSLGDPVAGGELARHNNFGCLRYHGADTPWGVLSDGKIWVAGLDWYSFPTPVAGMMAFGRYLKVGMKGLYLECLTSNPIDWRRFASVYYGQNVSGFENYVEKLKQYESKYRAMAAEAGLTL